jgi:hypothetical protein
MWAALALTTVLTTAPAQNGELAIKNVRSTHGILGQPRKENKLLPGDLLVVAFDITNLTVKPDGQVLYSMGMELTKKGKAKPEFKRAPQDLEAYNTLGGSTLPAFAMSVIGTDTPPGEYTLKVTVNDRGVKGGKGVTLEEKFEVLPLKLGFVQVKLTSASGEPVPPIAVPGQSVLLHCDLVGYKMAGQPKAPNVTFEMQVLDADGKPTVTKPFKGDIVTESKMSPGQMRFAPIILQLNRPGKFKVVIKATDNQAKKATTEQRLELNVLSGK